MNLPSQRGFGLIEIVVAAAIITVVVIAISQAMQSYIQLANKDAQYTQAALLTEEGSEAIRILRDKGWAANIDTLSLDTTYYLYWDGSQYLTTTTVTAIQNSYLRKIIFSSVKRDANDNIATTGTIDPNTRKVTMIIAPVTTTLPTLLQSDLFIHNVYNN